MKHLVLVESPAKAKTIEKYLGNKFKVRATYGHLRDLPTKEIGIDFEKNFKPTYVISKGKRKTVSALRKELKTAGDVYLAVDPDREGEAIGWHTAQLLGLITPTGNPKKNAGHEVKRIVFHEITKDAVIEAVENPRKIDMNLVNAQQARRMLDRIVGYKLSPLLWRKIRYGLSAGRVQSVAVRLVVEKERERDAFKPEEYWEMYAYAKKGVQTGKPEVNILKKESGKEDEEKDAEKLEKGKQSKGVVVFKLKKQKLSKEKDAKAVSEKVSLAQWQVSGVSKKTVKKNPPAPLTTSLLQQAALNRLGFSSKRTMSVAQKLYEKGLITYMRTDSMHIATSAVKSLRKFIKSEYGDIYLSEKERHFKTKSKTAQEAHEAIRPTKFDNIPSNLAKLTADEKKLYNLIWRRNVALQMSSALIEKNIIHVEVEGYTFEAIGSRIEFDGYLKVYKQKVSEHNVPSFEKGDNLNLQSLDVMQKFTMPPARYTEATLIKALEKEGIGRPSTYASIMFVIVSRGYVDKDGKYFYPTDNGYVINDLLVKHFPDIVDLKFTAKMEDDLDEVALGNRDYIKLLEEFYGPFEKNLEEQEKLIKKEEVTKLGDSNEKCPKCGGKMIIKLGKNGRFLSCARFPECDGILSLQEEDDFENSKEFKEKYEPAPKADDGSLMILKTGRYGRFWAHPDYPKVKETKPLLLKEKCPECGKNLVERKGKWGRTFIGCSGYPNCKYIKKRQKST